MAEKPTRKVEVTRLLKQWREGRGDALELLMPVVYEELRRMARIQLSRERSPHALQPTELVHEAFVRLVDQKADWQSRLHFYGIASRCMRRVLIDHARKRLAAKRPPGAAAVDLEKAELAQPNSLDTVLALDEALNQLEARSPRQAQIAELKLFGGLDISEIAQAVGVSDATVKRDWLDAKTLVARRLTEARRDVR